VRKFGDASRGLYRDLLGQDVPAPHSRARGQASGEHIAISESRHVGRMNSATRDGPPGGRAATSCSSCRVLKLPLAAAGLAVTAGWWLAGRGLPLGASLLLAAPWLAHAFTRADRSLIRRLLGPAPVDERIRTLRETRARAVDDSATRLRGIERDLHDGTQAQLVALAMKLGLAKEKLSAAVPADVARATQLVDDAHRGAIVAIAGLRVLARGIHPPVLDNGLADALHKTSTFQGGRETVERGAHSLAVPGSPIGDARYLPAELQS
jgi:signal transduction histidine kinase